MRFAHMAVDQRRPVGPVAIDLRGLQPGVAVLITETVGHDGRVRVTLALPPSNVTVQQRDSGVVTGIGENALELGTDGGADLRFNVAPDQLWSLRPCETVDVTYHQDAGLLIADGVLPTGVSGTCTPSLDATGPISKVSARSITVHGKGGPIRFGVDSPWLSAGLQNGDVVAVTYVRHGDGTLTATDVEYVERDLSGTVTAVSAQSVTVSNSGAGGSERFTADLGRSLRLCSHAFDGVHVGDQIDVTYHRSAAGMVADSVDDPGAGS